MRGAFKIIKINKNAEARRKQVASYRVFERRYGNDVEVCKDVCENIRKIPRRRVLKKSLFLAFGVNTFRECLLYVLGWENSKRLGRLTGSAMFRRRE